MVRLRAVASNINKPPILYRDVPALGFLSLSMQNKATEMNECRHCCHDFGLFNAYVRQYV